MAKLDVAVAIAVLLVSSSASLGLDVQTAPARFGYNPDVGSVAQGPITEALHLVAEETNDILAVEVENRALRCLEKLGQDGDGEKCVKEVSELLVFGDRTSRALSFPCCRNILAMDMQDSRCWEFLFGGQSEVQIAVPGLVATCAQAVFAALASAPAPAPGRRA